MNYQEAIEKIAYFWQSNKNDLYDEIVSDYTEGQLEGMIRVAAWFGGKSKREVEKDIKNFAKEKGLNLL